VSDRSLYSVRSLIWSQHECVPPPWNPCWTLRCRRSRRYTNCWRCRRQTIPRHFIRPTSYTTPLVARTDQAPMNLESGATIDS